jgi:hypothetical protein
MKFAYTVIIALIILILLGACGKERGKIREEDRNYVEIEADTNCLEMWNHDLLEFNVLNYDSVVDTLTSYTKYILGKDLYDSDLHDKVRVYIKNAYFAMEEKLSSMQWIVDTTNLRHRAFSEIIEEDVVPMELQWDHLFSVEDVAPFQIRGRGFSLRYEIYPCIKTCDEDYSISKYVRYGSAIPHYIAKDAKGFMSKMKVRNCYAELTAIIYLYREDWSGTHTEYYLIEMEDKAKLFHEHSGKIN